MNNKVNNKPITKQPKTPQYIKDALKIYELEMSLENIYCDDKKNIVDYTLKEILKEAKYVLSCYFECGHVLNEMYSGNEGIESKKEARSQVRKLKNFIKKYESQ